MDFIEFDSSGRRWRAQVVDAFDLAIALEFDGPQPRFFADGPATSTPLRAGGFSGSVAEGASCNCDVQTLAPHCHGTHTECVGHVTRGHVALHALTPAPPALALLLSVGPVGLRASGESGPPTARDGDPVLSRGALEAAARAWGDVPATALVLQTLPRDPARAHRRYAGPCPAPYFTREAMDWIVGRGIVSLVVDLPSLDRADDGGALVAHRVYWGLPPGSSDAAAAQRPRALVTELACVPAGAVDGTYLLDLQVPAFAADAAPSRPVLYRVTEVPQ